MAAERRLSTLAAHLCCCGTATPDEIASWFAAADPEPAWMAFEEQLDSWAEREKVVEALKALGSPTATRHFRDLYRHKMRRYIREDFYAPGCALRWKEIYERTGEASVPLLKPSCLAGLAAFADGIEARGKHRYGEPRPTYPPGEVLTYADDDPRKRMYTDVNMTAVACRHMSADDPIQWVYHSPDLRSFVKAVTGCSDLFPYLGDLGLAMNIMRPPPPPPTMATMTISTSADRTALGFHFDSIDSSSSSSSSSSRQQQQQQPKGATGVIGISDCTEGGERIVFPSIHRKDVTDVGQVLRSFDPLRPGEVIAGNAPTVCTEATAGQLYLFDGGDVLHGVSAVRKGTRIAAVFLFKEEPPVEGTADSVASADFFYARPTPAEAKAVRQHQQQQQQQQQQ